MAVAYNRGYWFYDSERLTGGYPGFGGDFLGAPDGGGIDIRYYTPNTGIWDTGPQTFGSAINIQYAPGGNTHYGADTGFLFFYADLNGGDGDDTITGFDSTLAAEIRAEVARVSALPGNAGLASTFDEALAANGITLEQFASGQDFLYGDTGDDTLNGRGGNDVLVGAEDNDTIDGGAGLDIAGYRGARGNYNIQVLGDGSVQIADQRATIDSDGVDLVRNVEFFNFNGEVLSVDELNKSIVAITPPNLIYEGNSGAAAFTFELTRTGDLTQAVSARWTISAGTTFPDQSVPHGLASAADFVGGVFPTDVAHFAANEASQTVTIHILGDTAVEPDEDFLITLSDPSAGAAISTEHGKDSSFIVNDDAWVELGMNSFNPGSNKSEGDGGTTDFTFTVSRSTYANGSSTATVDWVVRIGAFQNFSGVPQYLADVNDFAGGVLPHGQVTFGPNEYTQTIHVPVLGDTTVEADEFFLVELSNPSAGARLGSTRAQGTIVNDDGVAPLADDYAGDATTTGVIAPGGSITGNIETDFDRDWFRIEMVAGGVYTIRLDGRSSDSGTLYDPIVRLYSGTSEFLTSADAGGQGNDAKLVYTAPSTGTYFISAAEWQEGTGTYTVRVDAVLVSITATDATRSEGNTGTTTPFTFTVTRSGSPTTDGTVNWTLNAGSNPTANTADFAPSQPTSGTVTFNGAETSKTITINVQGDSIFEQDENFSITLSGPGVDPQHANATGVIYNDEVGGGGGEGSPTNHAPIITSDGGGDTASLSRPENATAVTTVTATDPDGDPVAYSVAGGADAALFSLDPATHALAFKIAPDFEKPSDLDRNSSYIVIVRASDGFLSDLQTITVNVTNVNEAPVITSDGGGATATKLVPENATNVTTAKASDPDAGSVITYAIIGGADQAKFSIGGSNGALTFVTAPDFESPTDSDGNNSYIVQVQARDNGNPQLTDVQTITVNVGNVDDSPVITSDGGGDEVTLFRPENQTAVTTVQAVDPEGGPITYHTSDSRFHLDARTGVLTFKNAPDFETPYASYDGFNTYRVSVEARDAASNSDYQTITIHVTDVNENGRNDFNGDGRSDVLFSIPGTTFDSDYMWQMNDRSIASQGAIDLYDKAFNVQVVGDFDGDGKSDVLFRNPTTGGVWQWLLNGFTIKSQGAVDVADPTFAVLGSADFNGDGKSDLLFRNAAGYVYMWQMDGRTNTPLAVGPLDPSWHVAGAGDFDGDGKADLLLHNISNSESNGAYFLWKMNGNQIIGEGGIERPDASWHTLAVGDFDGDGKSDIAIRNESASGDNGAVWVYLMDGITIKSQGAAGIVKASEFNTVGVGDYNGDGKDDILFRNNAGYFYSWDMNGKVIASEGPFGAEAGNFADPAFGVVTQHWDLL